MTALVDFIISRLDDLKAAEIQHIDVRGKSSVTDDMVICTGTSGRHVSSLAQKLIEAGKSAGVETFGEEGMATADWVVVDFGQAMVHIMQRESREMYQLEKLWA